MKTKSSSWACVGCIGELNQDEFVLCAIDKAKHIFKYSNNANESIQGSFNIYWYWHCDKSFGFAPNSIISLGCADHHDKSDNKRLSWCVHGTCAGSRVGMKTGFTSASYRKIIMIRI